MKYPTEKYKSPEYMKAEKEIGTDAIREVKIPEGMNDIAAKIGDTIVTPGETAIFLSEGSKNVDPDYEAAAREAAMREPQTGKSNNGDNKVWVRDYANAQGLGNIVSWDAQKNTVTVGGTPIPYDHISDGKAYVDPAILDKAIRAYEKRTGTQSPTQLTDSILSDYTSGISRALNKVTNRDEWSYDAESDPAYAAYAREYARNAERAYNRAMGSGGLYSSPNSYDKYQALAGYGDNMQRLSDMIPELADSDYLRYSDEQARNLQALSALQGERANELNAKYAANAAQLALQQEANKTDYDRRMDQLYTYPMLVQQAALDAAKGANELRQSDLYTEQYPTILNNDIRAKAFGNTESMHDIADAYAAKLGYYRKEDMDELGIAPDYARYPNSNGYPPPGSAEAQRLLRLWDDAERQIAREKYSISHGM